MSGAERREDYRARLQISRELGHERVDITDAYLGSRFARRRVMRDPRNALRPYLVKETQAAREKAGRAAFRDRGRAEPDH